MTTTTPPGWYPDGQGNTRYWDGNAWADVPAQPGAAPQQGAPQTWQAGYQPAPGYGGYQGVPPGYEVRKKKRFYQRVWFWLVVIPVVLIIVIVVSISAAVNKATNNPHTVVYSVTGTLGTADISYYSVDGSGNSSSISADNQKLPWTKQITIKGDFSGFDVSATQHIDINSADKTGTLSCSITVDGKTVSTDNSSGGTNAVLCNGSGYSGK